VKKMRRALPLVRRLRRDGMGERDRHEVESVDIDLNSHHVASARICCEFRPRR